MNPPRSIRPGGLLAAIVACVMLPLSPPLPAAGRRMVFHELADHSPQSAYIAYNTYPRISGNGERIVYAVPDAVTSRYRFRAVDFDGGNNHEIDYQSATSTGYFMSALSADGSTYAWTNSVAINVCQTAGSTGTEFLRLTNSNNIGGLALSDDGSKLYVLMRYDDVIAGSGTVLQAGLWEFTPASGEAGRRNILTREKVATALGIPLADVLAFYHQTELAVSQNAQQLACSFTMPAGGYAQVIGVQLDGSGIHPIGPPLFFPNGIAISADGGKVAVIHSTETTWESKATVAGFDGSGLTTLATGPLAGFPPISLTAGGSHLLLNQGWLYRTDGAGHEQLLHGPNNIPSGNMRSGDACTMSRDGRRFSYTDQPAGPRILNSLEIDPASTGLAPDLVAPAATPAWIVYDYGSTATVSVHATFPGTSNGVALNVFKNGTLDPAYFVEKDLFDNATHGDTTAADGTFTNNLFGVFYLDPLALGPKTLRFAAQCRDGSNKRHSTILDFAPFSVLTAPPAGAAPAIAGFTPATGPAGGRVTILGSGFAGTAAGNTVTFDGRAVEIVSVNPAGTQLVVDLPPWFAPGDYPVIVTANGLHSPPQVFTVTAAGQPPEITADPSTVAFGDVQTGNSADLLVTIRNTGNGPLQIASLAIDQPAFTHTGAAPPLLIAAGQALQLTVRFAPAATGPHAGTLTLANNDPDEPSVAIALQGNGTTAAVPAVVTLAATDVRAVSATLHGRVNPNATTASLHFEAGTITAYGTILSATPSSAAGSAETSFSATLTGLAPDTTYHFRAVATAASGTSHGNDLTFTTAPLSSVAGHIDFDDLAPGQLAADALAARGIASITHAGSGPGARGPRVENQSAVNSTIPSPPHVLVQDSITNDQGSTHILIFDFDPPLAAFSLDRVGKHSGGSTDTWRADFHNSGGTFLGSFGEPAPVTHAPVQTFSFSAPAGQTIARMKLISVWSGSATHRNIPVDNFVLSPAIAPLDMWRQSWFGSTLDSGDAADDADPDHDRLANLAEFATYGNPLASGQAVGVAVVEAGEFAYIYRKSRFAAGAGILFDVQWADQPAPAAWSSAGVTETVLSGDDYSELIKATIPNPQASRRFARLAVSR